MIDITRRSFIKLSVASASLTGLGVPGSRVFAAEDAGPWKLPAGVRILEITSTHHKVRHPRKIGRNSFRDHAAGGQDPLVRVRTSAGVEGIGNTLPNTALGKTIDELVELRNGRLWLTVAGKAILKPTDQAVILDIVGKLTGQPAYALLGNVIRDKVMIYDGSIYMRDLDTSPDAIHEDVANGVAAGHTAFKVKIGRGNWLSDRAKGYDRDMWAIGQTRAAAGNKARIMVDSNNYYTIDEARRLVKDTIRDPLYWMEEMQQDVKENHDNYRALRRAVDEAGLATLLADGESGRGDDNGLLPLLKEGVVKVSQPDIWTLGMFRYLDYGEKIRPFGALVAPHAWAKLIGALECCLLGMVMPNFSVIEDPRLVSDVVKMPKVTIRDGMMTPSREPGLGVVIDEDAYKKECAPQERTIRV